MMIKLPIIIVFLVIVGSLVQGMYYLAKDNGDRDKSRLVRALTVRISLSFVLFFMLMVSYWAGWIQPHTI
ncbi:MAG: twin transmembrane helix small protein [Gammaproteobacteria bacterium]|nr:twin transmembrane helix small protein [Gammaproteobacteria bacterium]